MENRGIERRDHYITLDGLRGLAALAVFLFHISYFWPTGKIFPRAYIAVDFFFLLSGFVIAKSYDGKLRETMGFRQFLRVRIIRLYPLICLGIFLGMADSLMKLRSFSHDTVSGILLEAAAGFFLLPDLAANASQLFPLNPPTWSLFYELLVNFAYGAISKHLRIWLIGGLILIAGTVFIYIVCTTGDTGRGAFPGDYPSGLSRVFLSFFMGVLLFRLQTRGLFQRLPGIPGLWLFLLLLLSFLPGSFPGGWVYNLACIFLLFPAIVVFGAKDNLPRRAIPAATWLGRISYPLYALHFPLIVRNSYHLTHGRHGLELAAATVFATICAVILAWLAAVFYDEPVRRILGGKKRRGTAQVIADPSPALAE